jgi:hypothetical protein
VCEAITQALLGELPDQESPQEIRDGVGKMIDDAPQIANDRLPPTNGQAIQLDDKERKY